MKTWKRIFLYLFALKCYFFQGSVFFRQRKSPLSINLISWRGKWWDITGSNEKQDILSTMLSPGAIRHANIKTYFAIWRHCRSANLKSKNVSSLEYLHFHLGIHRYLMGFTIFLTSRNNAVVLETKLYSKRKQPESWLYYWKQKTICIQQLYLDTDIWNNISEGF